VFSRLSLRLQRRVSAARGAPQLEAGKPAERDWPTAPAAPCTSTRWPRCTRAARCRSWSAVVQLKISAAASAASRPPARGSSRWPGACDRRRSTRIPSDQLRGRQAESRAQRRHMAIGWVLRSRLRIRASQSEFAADSALERSGFELLVPTCKTKSVSSPQREVPQGRKGLSRLASSIRWGTEAACRAILAECAAG
jgi:hypothetical protein